MKCRWNRTMLNLYGIVTAILKMATARNFSMSGINLGHHNLPTYQILMISENVEFLPPIFYAVFWQPLWKWQTFWKFRIDSQHRKISSGHHFQNGRHNTVQIQHCPISTTFHIWVDYDDLCILIWDILFQKTLIHYFKHNYALIQIYLFLISTLEMYLIIQVKIN
jgi:hypothetical protein